MLRVGVRVKGDGPCLVVMDSLGWLNTRPLGLIRNWLKEEWLRKESFRFSARDFGEKGIPTVTPSRLPRQPNLVDCALYLLTFIEEMLKR